MHPFLIQSDISFIMQVLLLHWRFLRSVLPTMSAETCVGLGTTQCAISEDATADIHLRHNVQTMFIVHLNVVFKAQYATLEHAFAAMYSDQTSAI